MPELPEVETVRRGLEPAMLGTRIVHVEQNRADLRFPFPDGFVPGLVGRTVTALRRRAKYILVEFDDGSVLLSHLGMSGSWRIEADWQDHPGRFHHPRSKDATHDHVVLHVAGPTGTTRIIYNDPRRFGFMDLARTEMLESHPMLAALGVEPTGNALNADYLAERLRGKQTSIKAALLDQRIIAGLGNIYVCEALWRARLSPRRKAHTLVDRKGGPVVRLETLTRSIRDVIADAIAAGGSSLRDHRQADGSLGYFQHSFDVYDREGQPCRRTGCSGTIRRIVQTGRSTFHCPSCQT